MATNAATLEIQVRTEDVKRAHTQLDKLAREGRDTTNSMNVLEKRLKRLNAVHQKHKNILEASVGKTGRFKQKQVELARIVNSAGAAFNRSSRALDRYSNKAERAARSSRRAKSSIHQLNNTLGSMRGIIAGVGLGLLARHIVEMGTNFDRIRNTMHAVFGTVEAANAAFEDMRGIANHLGADIFALADMYAQMSAASAGTQLEGEQTRDIFLSIAEASTVLRFNLEQTRGVIKAFEQMISKGTVQAEELRNQLGDRLPGAFNLFVRAYFGVETATESLRREFNTLMRTGQLVSAEVLPRVAEELRRTFGPGLEAARQSAQAEMNRMVTAFRLLSLSGWEAGFERTVVNVSNTLRSLFESENMIAIVRGTASAFEALSSVIYRFRGAIVPALAALTSFASVFIAGRLVQAVIGFLAVASGSSGIIGILAIIAGLATAAATAFGFMSGETQRAASVIEDVSEASGGYIDRNEDLAKSLSDTKDNTDKFAKALAEVSEATSESSAVNNEYRTVFEQMNWQMWTASVLGLAAAFNSLKFASNAAMTSMGISSLGALARNGRRRAQVTLGRTAQRAGGLGRAAMTASGFAMGFGATMDVFNRGSRRLGSRMIRNARSGNILTRMFRNLLSVVGLNNRAYVGMMRNGARVGGVFGVMTRAGAGLVGVLASVARLLGVIVRFAGGPIGMILGTLATIGGGMFMENRRRSGITRDFEQLQSIMSETNQAALLPANTEALDQVQEERDSVMETLNAHIQTAEDRIALSRQVLGELQSAQAEASNPQAFAENFLGEDYLDALVDAPGVLQARQVRLAEINSEIENQNNLLQQAQSFLEQLSNTAQNTTDHFDQAEEDLRQFAAFDREVLRDLEQQSQEVQFRVDTIGMDSFQSEMHRIRELMAPVSGAEGNLIPRSPEDLEMLQNIIDNLGILRAESNRQRGEDTIFGLRTGLMTEIAGEIAEINRNAEQTIESLLAMGDAIGLTEEQIRSLVNANVAQQIDDINERFQQLVQLRERAEEGTSSARGRLAGVGETRYEGILRQHAETQTRINNLMADAREEAQRQMDAGRDQIVVQEELNAVTSEYSTQLDLNNQWRDASVTSIQSEIQSVSQLIGQYRDEADQAGLTGEALKQLERQRAINDRLQEARAVARAAHEAGTRGSEFLSPAEREEIIAAVDVQLANEAMVAQAEGATDKMQELADEMQKIWENAADSISRTIMGAFDFTRPRQSIREFMLDVIRAVNDAILEIIRVQILIPVIKSAMSAVGIPGFASGGAFNGPVRAFAKGGITTQPTMFGYGGGRLGLMGEAGPEAVLPLARGRDGALGVQMHGGASVGGPSSIVIHNETNVYVEGEADAGEIAAKSSAQTKDVLKGLIAETMMEMTNSPGMGGKVTTM